MSDDLDAPPGEVLIPEMDSRQEVSRQMHAAISIHLFRGQSRIRVQIGDAVGMLILPHVSQILEFVRMRDKGTYDTCGRMIIHARALLPLVFEPHLHFENEQNFFIWNMELHNSEPAGFDEE